MCSVVTTLFKNFQTIIADNSRVGGGISPKFELIQAFMHILVTCTNEDDSIKNVIARVVTTFSHYKPMGIFPDAQGQLIPIWPNFEPFLDVIEILVTCKNKEDPIKNESGRMVTRFFLLYPYGSSLLSWKSEF